MEQCTYTREQIEAMQNVDIRSVAPNTLRDIRDVTVDQNLPKEERIAEFLRQIQNPYCFRCGKFTVRVRFASGGSSLEDCLKQILL